MTGNLKDDAAQFREVLEELRGEHWLRGEREWWPYYVMHYTDVQNAASILQDECIYSRSNLHQATATQIDSGSQEVLSRTDQWVKDYVRLYFRPRTPTQFHTEGIRTPDMISYLDVHCPVPVFFLFKAEEVLATKGTQFSDGNLASPGAQPYSSAVELRSLPWREIYHHGSIPYQQRSKITFHRCAEIIVPGSLGLDHLDSIHCRSEAEKEMLLNLLPATERAKFTPIIVASTRRVLFERRYTFVEFGRLEADRLHIQFSPGSICPGPFDLMLEVTGPELSRPQIKQVENFYTSQDFGTNFTRELSEYEVRVHLNEHLAYVGTFAGEEILV